MFTRFERMVAMRYLRPRRKESFISVIAICSLVGIFLGVAILIIVMAVMNGFRQELLTRILGLNGHVSITGPTRGITEYEDWSKVLAGVDGVVSVTPMVENQVMVTARGVARGAVVRGISRENLASRSILADAIVQGSIDAFEGADSILIGARMAERMGLRVGDKLTIISPKGNVTAFGSVPRVRAYTVSSIFDIGMFEYDSGFVFMPLDAAQTYFKLPGAVTTLEIFTNNPDAAPGVARAIYRDFPTIGQIRDWQRINASFFNALQVERNVMFVILTAIIIVAGFNIVSSMIMLVKDKGQDIAILRTMGATRGTIMRVFFLAGASLGIVGTVLGLIGGLLFASNIETIRQGIQTLTGANLFAAEIYFLSSLPAEIDPVEVAVVTGMGFVVSILATIYPSWRAARIEPAEALRYE